MTMADLGGGSAATHPNLSKETSLTFLEPACPWAREGGVQAKEITLLVADGLGGMTPGSLSPASTPTHRQIVSCWGLVAALLVVLGP